MSIKIELSLKSDIPKDITFELLDYFKKEIPGFEFTLKQLPPLPGEMGVEWISNIIYATSVASIEVTVHKLLEAGIEEGPDYIKNIVNKIKNTRDKFINKKNLSKLDISGTVRAGKTISFKIKGQNGVQYFNEHVYSINPLHTFVLLVGSGKYDQHSISNIPQAERNIKELYTILVDEQYFGIPPNHIKLSLDDTCHDIKDYLFQISKSKGIETFIFYYVGHGFSFGIDSYYLAARDTTRQGSFVNSGIEKEFIVDQILDKTPAKQKIAIIDACHSGNLALSGQHSLFGKEVKGSYILTSSNADEVSFYDKNESALYTFFTGAVLNTIKNGVNNDSETITLQDLYVETSEQLTKIKKPAPYFKNGLNVAPSNFIISHNVAFTPEEGLRRIAELIANGKFDDVPHEYQKLIKKFPDNKELEAKALQFHSHRMYVKYVDEGNMHFYTKKNYAIAEDYYRKALDLEDNTELREKINTCIRHLDSIPGKNNKKGITWLKGILISLLSVFIAVLISHYYFTKDVPTPNNTKHDTVLNSGEKADSLWEAKEYKLAIAMYDSLRMNLSASKLLAVARLYDTGSEYYHISKDSIKSIQYYKMSGSKGNVDACGWLAGYYRQKYFDTKNPNKVDDSTFIWSMTGALAGDTIALYNVGFMYCNGKWKGHNEDSGIKYLTIASQKGMTRATSFLKRLNEKK